jgi:hypothetical protein
MVNLDISLVILRVSRALRAKETNQQVIEDVPDGGLAQWTAPSLFNNSK